MPYVQASLFDLDIPVLTAIQPSSTPAPCADSTRPLTVPATLLARIEPTSPTAPTVFEPVIASSFSAPPAAYPSSDAHPQPKRSSSRSSLPKGYTLFKPVVPPAGVQPHEGFSNSATYLALLYIYRSAEAMQIVADAIRQHRRTKLPKALADKFIVVRSPEDDTTADGPICGFQSDLRLYIDHFAEGDIVWPEISRSLESFHQQDKGLAPWGDDVLNRLQASRVEGTELFVPYRGCSSLSWQRVIHAVSRIGGVFDPQTRRFSFESDPSAAVESFWRSGHPLSQHHGHAMPVPASLAARIVDVANLTDGLRTLEPCALNAALADLGVPEVGPENWVSVQPDLSLSELYGALGVRPQVGSFLAQPHWGRNLRFDRALLVLPPGSDPWLCIDYAHHAFSMLASGGLMVAALPSSLRFSQEPKAVAFRGFLSSNGATVLEDPSYNHGTAEAPFQVVLAVVRKRDVPLVSSLIH